MAKLLYVPRFDQNGAGPRYRVYQFFDNFRLLGIEITVKPLFDIQYLNNLYFKKKRSIINIFSAYFKRAVYLISHKRKFDLVFMDGELFPFIPYFIEKLFLPKHYIIDQDDAIFHTYDCHRLWVVRKLLGNKIAKVWRNSRHLIVCNAYVKEKALLMKVKDISVLPTVVDANKYISLKHHHHRSMPNRKLFDWHGEIIIGWVGSPTTVKSINLIKHALLRVREKADIVLYVIGADYHLEGIRTICVDWKEGWNENIEIELINQIDIGIMPLFDSPYEKGKGGFKLIKYMACEKPVIASPVGMNVDIVDHGVNGYLAATEEEWEKYLLTLIENAQQRKQFGSHGREKMVAQYSHQAVAPCLCDIVVRAMQVN